MASLVRATLASFACFVAIAPCARADDINEIHHAVADHAAASPLLDNNAKRSHRAGPSPKPRAARWDVETTYASEDESRAPPHTELGAARPGEHYDPHQAVRPAAYQEQQTAKQPDRTERRPQKPPPRPATRDTWSGVDIRTRSRSTYTGATQALFTDLEHSGFRLRTVSGYGVYSVLDEVPGSTQLIRRDADTIFVDILLGYEFQAPVTTWKAFIGGTGLVRDLTPLNPLDHIGLSKLGIKGTLETWTNISERTALKLDIWVAHLFGEDVTFTQLHAELLLARRLSPAWLVGLEAAALTDRPSGDQDRARELRYDSLKLGAHAAWQPINSVTVSASAGLVAERAGEQDDLTLGAYGRFQFAIRY